MNSTTTENCPPSRGAGHCWHVERLRPGMVGPPRTTCCRCSTDRQLVQPVGEKIAFVQKVTSTDQVSS